MATKKTSKKTSKKPSKKAGKKTAKKTGVPTEAEMEANIERSRKKREERLKEARDKAPEPKEDATAQLDEQKMLENAPVSNVAFADIKPDLKFNARKHYSQIDSLAHDIQQVGLLMPLTVRKEEDGGLKLIAGYRRYHAISRLREEWAKLPAKERGPQPFEAVQCKVIVASDLQTFVVNVRENLSRTDLRIWELGDQCKAMKDKFGLTGAQVSAMLSYHKTTIDNAIRVVENIAPDVQKKFRKSQLVPSVSFLRLIAGYRQENGEPDHDRQRQAWEEEYGAGAPGSGSDGDGGSDAQPDKTGKMRTLKHTLKALAGLEDAKKTADPDMQDYLRGATAAMKYCMGLNKNIGRVRLNLDDH